MRVGEGKKNNTPLRMRLHNPSVLYPIVQRGYWNSDVVLCLIEDRIVTGWGYGHWNADVKWGRVV